MQDLLGKEAYDVTDRVELSDGRVRVPGDVIHEIGTCRAHPGDTSEPGLVLTIKER